jgi:hypothetical protein
VPDIVKEARTKPGVEEVSKWEKVQWINYLLL